LNKDTSYDHILIAGFLFLLAPPLLYALRHIDDNTLTAWRWIFPVAGVGNFYLWTLTGVVFAYGLSRTSWPQRRPMVFLFIVTFASAVPLWSEPEVILDTSRYFTQAKYLSTYGAWYFLREWGRGIWVWTDLPAAPFFYGLVFRYAGEARLYIQLLNTLLFSLTVVTVFLIGKRLWDAERGFFAGLLLLGIPYLLVQPPLMLVDIPAMFLFTLSIFTFLLALDKGGPARICLCSFVIFLAVFSKYSVALMLVSLPLAALAPGKTAAKVKLARGGWVIALAALLSFAFFMAKYGVFADQLHLLASYQWPGLERWQESFTSTFLFQTHPFITAAAFYGVYLAIRRRDKKFLIAGWFFIFTLLLEVKRIRYLVPMFPLFTLAASYGLCRLGDDRLKRFAGYSIAATSLALVYTGFLPFLGNMSAANLQRAGGYLDTLGCGGAVVYTLPQRNSAASTQVAIPILDYLTSVEIIAPDAPDTMTAKTGAPSSVSSLRFTWEYEKPRYYRARRGVEKFPLVIISSERLGEPPPEIVKNTESLKTLKEFAVFSGMLRYRTFVTILGQACQ